MRLTGTLLEIEEYSGEMKGDDGKPFAFSGKRLHVLEGREVIKVKIPKNLLDTHGYTNASQVDLRVTVQAQQGARGAYLSTTLVGNFEPARHAALTKVS
jgi:hypothetical protein